jgi:hypothetical protein
MADSGSVALITADEGVRGGKRIGLKGRRKTEIRK